MFSSRSEGWDDLTVLCAANSYDTVKLADQHIAEELARLTPVLYVDPPMSCLAPLRELGHSWRLVGPRLRLQGPSLARLTPVVGPFPSKPAMTGLTESLLRRYIRWAIIKLRANSVSAIISGWPNYRVFGVCNEEVSLYWAQDDFVGGAALLGRDPAHLERCENEVSAAADFVVAANPLVAQKWRSKGLETLLIPYGTAVNAYADVESAPLPQDVDLPDPIVGFVGHINSRIDMRLLEAVADRGRSLLLVGPKKPTFEPQLFGDLVNRPNVRWLGYKAFDELPGYFRRIAVGLVPYGDSAFNRGSFPLKTLEYLAAGLPVVSTDLPASRWLATDLIGIASEPAPFANLVDRMITEADEDGLVARRREFAAGHSYAARAAEFYAAIRDHREHQRTSLRVR